MIASDREGPRRGDAPFLDATVRSRTAWPFHTAAALLTTLGLLSGCGVAVPIVIGPPDLDDSSAEAPRCGPLNYPFNARTLGETGLVLVRAQVARNGHVLQAAIESPSISDHLNGEALRAVMRCKFANSNADNVRQYSVTVVYEFMGDDDKLPIGVVRLGLRGAQPAAR